MAPTNHAVVLRAPRIIPDYWYKDKNGADIFVLGQFDRPVSVHDRPVYTKLTMVYFLQEGRKLWIRFEVSKP